MTVENDEILKRARAYNVDLPETENSSQSSVKTASKYKSASQTSKKSTSRNSKTSSHRQREHLNAKHRRKEIERQTENMLHWTQQKQELDRPRLKQEKQSLDQEGEFIMRKEQALMLAELDEDKRRKLAEATLTELELSKMS